MGEGKIYVGNLKTITDNSHSIRMANKDTNGLYFSFL